MSQLRELAKPFQGRYVKEKPGQGGGSYVPHSTITERLLQVLGPFDLELVDVIRGRAEEVKTKTKTYPAREGAIVGIVARMRVTIDGRCTTVEEVGTEDAPARNSDAENLKNSMSDAVKRCAMRLGLGLHLWSDDLYFLDRALERDAQEGGGGAERVATVNGAPPPEETVPQDDTPARSTEARPARLLTVNEAARLMTTLRSLGIRNDQQLAFARTVTGRDNIESYADLTTDEARRIHARANGEPEDDEAMTATNGAN